MKKKTDINSLTINIREDFKKSSKKEIDEIYNSLKIMLKKYDDDSMLKDICDLLKRGLTIDKRKRCERVLEDILEVLKDENYPRKEELRRDLLDLSNIHRGILENIIALIEGM